MQHPAHHRPADIPAEVLISLPSPEEIMRRAEDATRLCLLKLADGARLLRVSEPQSGLCLEAKLDPRLSVILQKQRWARAFEVLLEREGLSEV